MLLKIFLVLQIFMGLWVLLNGFFVGEKGWIYSAVFWLISAFLLIGSFNYLANKPSGRIFSILGMFCLALASGGILVYFSYLVFRGDDNFGIEGLYPFGIFSYSVFMAIFYLRKKITSIN